MISVTCYRLFHNSHDFEDYERWPDWDGRFQTAEEAIAYVHEMCYEYTTGEEIFTFEIIDESKTNLSQMVTGASP